MSQLTELARPFPDGYVERKDGNSYVAHHIINQRLLAVIGPFDFQLVEVIRGNVLPVAPDASGRSRRAKAGTPALQDVVVGAVFRLVATIDGRQVIAEEAGDVGDVHNWPHDGARLKDAASDALKRCAMRLGLGLHLWAQEHYFLHDQLAQRERQESGAVEEGEAPAAPDTQPAPPAGEQTPQEGAGANRKGDALDLFTAGVTALGITPGKAARILIDLGWSEIPQDKPSGAIARWDENKVTEAIETLEQYQAEHHTEQRGAA